MNTYFKIKLCEKLLSYVLIFVVICVCFLGTVLHRIFIHHQKRQDKISEEFWKKQEESDGKE